MHSGRQGKSVFCVQILDRTSDHCRCQVVSTCDACVCARACLCVGVGVLWVIFFIFRVLFSLLMITFDNL